MIEFKDFARKPKFGGIASQPFQTAVDAANEWLATEPGVRVLSIESVSDTSSFLATDIVTTNATGVRLWYLRG